MKKTTLEKEKIINKDTRNLFRLKRAKLHCNVMQCNVAF